MPSVLYATFSFKVKVDTKHIDEVEKLLSAELGPRCYDLQSQRGGKKWLIKNAGNPQLVELEDESLATYIALRYV